MLPNVVGVIMAGGAGSRLWPLTKDRAKPAVPIAGKFRLIDIPISNCINSEIRKISILTQFNSASLNRHVTQTFSFSSFSEGFAQILAAQQTGETEDWYQGTADSVRKNLRYFMSKKIEYVLILAGDHLYSMDYRKMLRFHIEKKADVTLGVLPVTREQSRGFGILKLNKNGAISDFIEKPQTDTEVDPYMIPEGWQAEDDHFNRSATPFLGSMGIYIFNKDVLQQLLCENDHPDFGKGIIPYAIENRKVFGYMFNGYWEDVGTIRSFFDAMMDLVQPVPKFNFYEAGTPIYTRPRFLPGAKITGCHVCRSVVNEGAILEECSIEDTMIGIRSRIRCGSKLNNTIIMGRDFYESNEENEENKLAGIPDTGIGRDCVIDTAIIDKNARIGDGVKILNQNRDQEIREENYVIRDGIVIVPKNAIIPSGTVIG